MNLELEPASDHCFRELAEWRYEGPYDFYDDDGEAMLNPERYLFARGDDGVLAGFFYFDLRGDELEIGLGLRPELAGRGLGLEFFRLGVEVGRERFSPARVTLNVAAFNDRARLVYERAGFREVGRHMRTFARWGQVEFVEMEEAPA